VTAPKMLVLTMSDRLLTTEGGHPSLTDIAVGMSRQPRFGGQTKSQWSVLDHSLFCDELVRARAEKGVPTLGGDDEEAVRRWRLAVLLHDAHEALTGDVPSPLKTADFKAMQRELDRRIYNAYYPGGYFDQRELREEAVHRIDLRALRVEAVSFLPHDTERIISIFGQADPDDYGTMSWYLGYTYAGLPPLRDDQRTHPAVQEYLNRVLALM
jgi:hypothetical protein